VQRSDYGSDFGAHRPYGQRVRLSPPRWTEYAADEAGHFLVTDLATSTYALRFESAGAASVFRAGIAVPPETVVDVGEVVLEREAVVRGIVIPPLDESPAKFRVLLDSEPFAGTPPAGYDFEFRGLSSGVHEITWMRRDGGGTQAEPLSRSMEVEVQPGDVRDVTVDATGGATSKLTVHVRINGGPAGRCFLRATTDLEGRDPLAWGAQATSDTSGKAVLLLRPGERVLITVAGETMRELGRAEPLVLAEAEERELTLDLALGHVVVRLPPGLEIPRDGQITLQMRNAAGRSFAESASTLPNRENFARHPLWNSNRVEFGAYAAGSYTARLRFERVESSTGDPARVPFRLTPVRAAFEAEVVVVAGREVVITVPE
jgi:hypothetical protein